MYTVDIMHGDSPRLCDRDIEQGVDAMVTPRRRTLRSFFTAILALTILPLLAGAASALDNGQCLDCHGDPGILGWSPAEKASNVTPGGAKRADSVFGKFPGMSLHVDPGLYKPSVHADVSCTDCHADVKALPHTARLKRVDCSGCHSEVAAGYAKSRHVVAADRKPVVNAPDVRGLPRRPCGAESVPLHLSDLLPEPRRHLRPVPREPRRSPTKRNIGIPGAATDVPRRASTTGPSSRRG